jgi:cytoskeletal protein CcmA (bactofilin family)
MRSINNYICIYYKMSLSLHRIISQRAVNKTVQYDNRLTEFTNPPIHTGDLYVKRDLYVYGNERVRGNLDVSGNVDISGNLDVSGNENVTGDLRVSGTILASQFLPGQVIFTNMINITGSNQTITANTTSDIITYSYTPKNANSSILMEFQTKYTLGGAGTDSARAELWVDSSNISYTYQQWGEALGGGTRSGIIFPIVGKYTNSSITAKNIIVKLQNSTDADAITVYKDTSCWLKVTEIGR